MACRLVGAKAIIWTNDGILLIWPSGTNFSEMLIGIHIFSLKKMHLKMPSGYRRPFCLGLNVLRQIRNGSANVDPVSVWVSRCLISQATQLFVQRHNHGSALLFLCAGNSPGAGGFPAHHHKRLVIQKVYCFRDVTASLRHMTSWILGIRQVMAWSLTA